MAGDSELEKTEAPSARRLEQAREEGDIARSRELATCVSLLTAGGMLWITGASVIADLSGILRTSLAFKRETAFDFALLLEHAGRAAGIALWSLWPLALALLLVTVLSPIPVGGWLFSPQLLTPKFSRLNPVSGLANMFSVRSLVELLKAILKAALVATVAWLVARGQLEDIFALINSALPVASKALGSLLFSGFIAMAAALILIAAIDAPYQVWQHTKKLKMTREEVRQENKEQEGNPEIKARIRSQQRDMARRRMMAAIPTADVVVTNPEHYAVALQYKDGGHSAPVVVAKGCDAVAAKIREIARANGVPLLAAPPLARALYRHAELGDPIPEKLYTAVAQVLAYVFALKSGAAPAVPEAIEVPDGLDPLAQTGGLQ